MTDNTEELEQSVVREWGKGRTCGWVGLVRRRRKMLKKD